MPSHCPFSICFGAFFKRDLALPILAEFGSHSLSFHRQAHAVYFQCCESCALRDAEQEVLPSELATRGRVRPREESIVLSRYRCNEWVSSKNMSYQDGRLSIIFSIRTPLFVQRSQNTACSFADADVGLGPSFCAR
jgi:hypothetical protein